MKVIVIGGTGHIGSFLTPQLVEAGWEVTVVSSGRRVVDRDAFPPTVDFVKQTLSKLPEALHKRYHKGLDKVLPRRFGAEYYKKLDPKEQAEIFAKFEKYTKDFDTKHKTKIWDMVVDEATTK